jgi:UDP-N-acetylmuramate dehydrogenase
MKMFEQFIATFREKELGILVENEPLAKHTTLRVGGPARILVQPNDRFAIIESIELAKKLKMKFKILGKGSNLLFSDDFFEGVVIKTDKGLNYTIINDTRITVGAGVSDVKLARNMAKLGLSGLEFLSGIPGTIGGAVFMNAGAYLKEMKDVLVEVVILDEAGIVRKLTLEEMELSYRTSIFQRHTEWLIIEAVLQLELGDKDQILDIIKSRKEKRMQSQPLEMPSAGSTFRNPAGLAAWKLVADAGLRGFTIGGAMVSEKHTNFVVNANKATAQDIADVIWHVSQEINDKCGLEMHQEVEFFNWN